MVSGDNVDARPLVPLSEEESLASAERSRGIEFSRRLRVLATGFALLFGLVVLVLVGYQMEVVFGLRRDVTATRTLGSPVSLTRKVDHLDWTRDKPVSIGSFNAGARAVFHLHTRFRLDDAANLPNLFQTAATNDGLRLEASGSNAAIVWTDHSVPSGLSALNVAHTLQYGVWYTLDVRARSGAYIQSALRREGESRSEIAHLSTPSVVFATSDIRLGGGFDETRFWRGALADTTLTIASDEEINGTYRFAQWKSTTDDPIDIGAADEPNRAYFRLTLQLLAEDTDGYPNVFQTADGNAGLRMEISGKNAAVVFPDNDSPSKIRALTLTNDFRVGQWYTLEVEAQDDGYVKARLHPAGPTTLTATLAASEDMRFSTDSILVGAAFGGDRTFHGALRDVSLTIGKTAPGLCGSQKAFFLILAICAVVFVLFLIRSLSLAPTAQRLVIRVACLGIILVPLVLYFEFRLSGMNTNFLTKRIALEPQLRDIEVLSLGSSNAVYGIDPARFSLRGFNLANPGQSLYYDENLLRKYLPRMEHLKLVILDVNFLTFGTDGSLDSQRWRQDFYRKYFSIATENPAHRSLGFFTHAPNFSYLAMFGNRSATYARQDYRPLVDIVCNKNGWFDAGTVAVEDDSVEGPVIARNHSALNDEHLYPQSLAHLRRMIEALQARGVGAVIVNLPLPQGYRTALDPRKRGEMDAELNALARDKGIRYVNYANDPRFDRRDFSELVDHLNARGADKISEIINTDLIAPLKN